MPDTVAFLRSINVGGRRVTNDALRAAAEGAGFSGVSTYRASGNLLLSIGTDLTGVRPRLEAGLQAALGFTVPTILRSAAQVDALLGHAPFPPEVVAQTAGKLQVMLLSEPPGPDARERALALAPADDRLAFFAGDLFWLPRAGISTSELEPSKLGRVLGLNTVRTVGTIAGIAKKLRAG